MELWAQGPLGGHVDFLCVCVESLEVALMFGRMFKFQHVTNCWIPNPADMPRYGQLGCSGFVVLDGDGKFLRKKTSAFLQMGEDAFRDLEYVVRRAMPTSTPPTPPLLHADYPYRAGAAVSLDGLKNTPELNGQTGTILNFSTSSGRFQVQLKKSGRSVSVRPCCVAPLEAAPGGGGADVANASSHKEEEKESTKRPRVEEQQQVKETGEKFPGSVGVASMDKEHEMCWAAIEKLRKEASGEGGGGGGVLAALEAVRAEMAEHFAEEEQLMIASGFGGNPETSFSAVTGHKKDHQRILREIVGLQDSLSASPPSCCSNGEEKQQQLQPQLQEVARRVALSFTTHVRLFDKLYDGKLNTEGDTDDIQTA